MSRFRAGTAVVVFVVASSGCSGADSAAEVAGSCAPAWGSDVCTWVVESGGSVEAVGATIPVSALEAAPADAPFEWPPATAVALDFPSPSGGMTHFTLNWEAMGHPPQTFLVPHFDFHFYVISSAERMAIDCANPTKGGHLPEGYTTPDEALPPELAQITGVDTLIGSCVPEMGMHAISHADMERAEPFGGSMIIGYWQDEPIFIEPMVSQALLLDRASFDLEVPTIPGLEGVQPTTFRAEYVADEDAYRFSFTGFAGTAAGG